MECSSSVAFQALELLVRPVAVDALDVRRAILGDLREQAFDDGGLRVVRIDQHGEVVGFPD